MKRLFSLKIGIIALISLVLCRLLTAQVGYQLVGGAKSLGMGGTGVTFQDEQAIFHNPAGLVGVSRPTALLSSEIRFGIKDLKPIGCAFILPTSSSVLGFSFQNFRLDSYRESKLGLSYARRLASKFNIGIQIEYENFKIDEYGSSNLLNFNIGCQALIVKDLVLSASIFNPIPMKINESEQTPSVFRLGLGYSVNAKVLICLETEKDIAFPASYKFGFAYDVLESMTLRCGFRTPPSVFSFGLGYKINKNFTIDCALANHAYLGMTPALGLSYGFGQNKTAATE
jgi:hypothetical protein